MTLDWRTALRRITGEHGMLVVLVLLCAFFSYATFTEQHSGGVAGAARVLETIREELPAGSRVLVVARMAPGDEVELADALESGLRESGYELAGVVRGDPADARRALEAALEAGTELDAIACSEAVSNWPVFDRVQDVPLIRPEPYRWPVFLNADNLLNIANQIAVIAILAIGMTFVILTGGIDLSVGSLIALSAVVSAYVIREYGGAVDAGVLAMIGGCAVGILACAAAGAFSGTLVTVFGMPPFIATLAMMLIGSGAAYIIARGTSIYELPPSFEWLGVEDDLLRIPNAVVLMALLYAVAHVITTRTAFGRYVYAVGGNAEAARLSGVPVRRVVVIVYALSGALAGVGGVILASQLGSGSPTYGLMYELYVIAAVVVGGTSISGGEGKILGTLVGAFIIAVIQNGMNLTGLESYTQKVVLGLVILGAVLVDRLQKKGWLGARG